MVKIVSGRRRRLIFGHRAPMSLYYPAIELHRSCAREAHQVSATSTAARLERSGSSSHRQRATAQANNLIFRSDAPPTAASIRSGSHEINHSDSVILCSPPGAPCPFSRSDSVILCSQREATGLLLEAGMSGLQKATRGAGNDLSTEETLGLECVILLYGRPALLLNNGVLASPPPLWNVLEDQREFVETAQRGVGRIELLGHPEYDWAGSGFLVSENALLTTRKTAELFVENRSGTWQFRPGITTWMNYRSSYQDVASAGYRVRAVLGVHDRYDLALLEVERSQFNGTAPLPLSLAAQGPAQREGRPVYLIGYPVRDARRNEPEAVARIFRDVYNVKRVQPGLLRGEFTYHEVTFLSHDAAPLGQNSGAPILDLETNQVIGVQTTGRYLETSTAVPLYLLRDDALLRQAGVTFTEPAPQDQQTTFAQLERLSRSRYWNETRSLIANLHQRAFGNPSGNR
jgi:hypothetical protein